MRMTRHAQERWQQRCSHLDLATELAGARRAGKRILNKLRSGWERAQGIGTWPAHYDYFTSVNGVVFVTCDGAVLTVMRTKDVKRWNNRHNQDDRLRRRHALV